MSHIVEFSISGLAGREGVYAQTLDRHLNVFFGLNGSGKTSLLKILHSAMTKNSRILETVPFESAEVKIYSINHDLVFTCQIDKQRRDPVKATDSDTGDVELFDRSVDLLEESSFVVEFGQGRVIQFAEWNETPPPGAERPRRWKHRYLPTSRLYQGLPTMKSRIGRSSLRELSEEELDQYHAEILQDLWRNFHADILSATRDAQEDGLASILKAVLVGKREPKEGLRRVDLEVAYDRVSRFLKRRGSEGILG